MTSGARTGSSWQPPLPPPDRPAPPRPPPDCATAVPSRGRLWRRRRWRWRRWRWRPWRRRRWRLRWVEVAMDAAGAAPARTAWLREASVAASVEASQGTQCYCTRSSPWPHSGLAGSPGLRRAWSAHRIGMPTSYSLPPRAASLQPAAPFVRAARSLRAAPLVLARERMACLVSGSRGRRERLGRACPPATPQPFKVVWGGGTPGQRRGSLFFNSRFRQTFHHSFPYYKRTTQSPAKTPTCSCPRTP